MRKAVLTGQGRGVSYAQDIRWKLRYDNYRKAFQQLTEFITKGELNKFEVQGLIQFFEYTVELG
ncbi:nucleotidyltransferase substrate binding protein [Caldalkalibacillus thermarum]|uniref:nucleotidyltransferase substrate binding protein n=1 Tax=Caldalkalibacillus thermarum TaxID=296745 RepID=UPI003B42A36B